MFLFIGKFYIELDISPARCLIGAAVSFVVAFAIEYFKDKHDKNIRTPRS